MIYPSLLHSRWLLFLRGSLIFSVLRRIISTLIMESREVRMAGAGSFQQVFKLLTGCYKLNGKDTFSHAILDISNQILKQDETLLLIFYQGIFIGIGPQTDTLFEQIHLVKMVSPVIIDNLKK